MLGDSSLASTGKVVTTAIKHGGHSIFGLFFTFHPLATSVILLIAHIISKDYLITEASLDLDWPNSSSMRWVINVRDPAHIRNNVRDAMMGMKWGNVELILRYSYIKQTFCFYSFSFGQMHFLLPFPG